MDEVSDTSRITARLVSASAIDRRICFARWLALLDFIEAPALVVDAWFVDEGCFSAEASSWVTDTFTRCAIAQSRDLDRARDSR